MEFYTTRQCPAAIFYPLTLTATDDIGKLCHKQDVFVSNLHNSLDHPQTIENRQRQSID